MGVKSEFECPSCEAAFDTRRGLGVHHVHIHNERLPNRRCDLCEEEFYSDYAKKYCSKQCLLESDSYAGENNPAYTGAQVTTTCQLCDSKFSCYPSEKRGLYCKSCVENASWRDPPRLAGERHPNWKGGKCAESCAMCGETVERHPGAFVGDDSLQPKMSSRVALTDIHRRWPPKLGRWTDRPVWSWLGSNSSRRARKRRLPMPRL